jgi:hypothetical protein
MCDAATRGVGERHLTSVCRTYRVLSCGSVVYFGPVTVLLGWLAVPRARPGCGSPATSTCRDFIVEKIERLMRIPSLI